MTTLAPVVFGRGFRPTGAVLLVPPLGEASWSGSTSDWIAEGPRLWQLAASEVRCWPIGGVHEVVETPRAARWSTRTSVYRVDAGLARRAGWADGVEAGGLRVKLVDGVLFVQEGRTWSIDTVDPDERVHVGPRGQVAIAHGARGLRVAPPGRTPVAVDLEVGPGLIRWSRSGRSVVVDTPEGPRSVDVATRTATPTRRPPSRAEATCASSGAWLAAPDGHIVDLLTGRSPEGPRLCLGATVGAPDAFVTVHWESHRGFWRDFDGRARDRFRLPLDPDDTVTRGAWLDGAARFESAEGRQFLIRGHRVEEVAPVAWPRTRPTSVDGPAGPFLADGSLVVGGRTFAWGTASGALGWPTA